MTVFNFEHLTEQPNQVSVEVDRRFDVVVERTESGLSLRVYPITDGELWDAPFAVFEVDEMEVVSLEKELVT